MLLLGSLRYECCNISIQCFTAYLLWVVQRLKSSFMGKKLFKCRDFGLIPISGKALRQDQTPLTCPFFIFNFLAETVLCSVHAFSILCHHFNEVRVCCAKFNFKTPLNMFRTWASGIILSNGRHQSGMPNAYCLFSFDAKTETIWSEEKAKIIRITRFQNGSFQPRRMTPYVKLHLALKNA